MHINKIGRLLILLVALFSLVGCSTTTEIKPVEGMHVVRDFTGAEVQVPDKPQRIVPVGVSTEDMVIALNGIDNIAALGVLPNNYPNESNQVKTHIAFNTEGILSLKPDLLIIPDWVDQEQVTTLRALKVPLYVYKSPRSLDEIKGTISEMGVLLNRQAEADKIVADMNERLAKVHTFTAQFPERKTVAYYGVMGLSGGIGSTFASMAENANVNNAAVILGLGSSDKGTKEDLLVINPDVIILPSDAYSRDQYKEIAESSIYSDEAFQNIKAVKNKQVFVIDAVKLMSYSQFAVNAVEDIAAVVYGYKK